MKNFFFYQYEPFGKNKIKKFRFKNFYHRYTKREKFCSCIPLIIFEYLFPIFSFGLIIYLTNILFNNNMLNENDKTLLFNNDLNEHGKCSPSPFQNNFMNENNYKNKIDFENNCLKDFLNSDVNNTNHSKITLFLNLLNKKNETNYLFTKLVNEITNQLNINNCYLYEKTKVILLNDDVSNRYKNEKNILFNKKMNSFNIIININELSYEKFLYQIIIEMPNNNLFQKKLKYKIDKSFLENYQHPAEQIVIFLKFKLINLLCSFF